MLKDKMILAMKYNERVRIHPKPAIPTIGIAQRQTSHPIPK
jgi:hypothetical protein